jgi:hypothetical protein
MNYALKSYELCSNEDLRRHVTEIDTQCQNALDHYKGLIAQRSTVLEALGVSALQTITEGSSLTQYLPLAVVA